MRMQSLHLCAYHCENCGGPVITGWLAIRENEIRAESDIRQLAAICLNCGNQQTRRTTPIRHFLPVEWDLRFHGGRESEGVSAGGYLCAATEQNRLIDDPLGVGHGPYRPNEPAPASITPPPDLRL